MIDKQSTFILPLTQGLLSLLRLLLPAFWLEALGIFYFWVVDLWVVFWTLGALTSYISSFSVVGEGISTVIIVCGVVRVAEIVLFHLSELLTFSLSQNRLRSYRRTIVLLLMNYFEIVLWFATFYSLMSGSNYIAAHAPVSISPLRESISLMVANSSGALDLQDSFVGWSTVTVQSAIGLFLTTMVAARMIGLLPRPSTLDPAEQSDHHSSHGGKGPPGQS